MLEQIFWIIIILFILSIITFNRYTRIVSLGCVAMYVVLGIFAYIYAIFTYPAMMDRFYVDIIHLGIIYNIILILIFIFLYEAAHWPDGLYLHAFVGLVILFVYPPMVLLILFPESNYEPTDKKEDVTYNDDLPEKIEFTLSSGEKVAFNKDLNGEYVIEGSGNEYNEPLSIAEKFEPYLPDDLRIDYSDGSSVMYTKTPIGDYVGSDGSRFERTAIGDYICYSKHLRYSLGNNGDYTGTDGSSFDFNGVGYTYRPK